MFRPLIAVVALFGFSSATARDDYPKNPHIDIDRYVFQLELSDDTDDIRGEATILARFLADGVTELRLDLINAGFDSAGRGMTVHEVSSAGTALAFTHAAREASDTLASERAFLVRVVAFRHMLDEAALCRVGDELDFVFSRHPSSASRSRPS